MLTAERLREVAIYEHDTGLFRWTTPRRRVKVGSVAGTLSKRGYIDICIDVQVYKAHRLAWLYTYGEWPKALIDHVNGDKADNRLANLRPATKSQNGAHRTRMEPRNTSGHRNVRWLPRMRKWEVRFKHMGQPIMGGYYAELSEALIARDSLAARTFGEFYQPIQTPAQI